MLGDGSDLSANGHEIMVAVPAGYEVKVEVVSNAGAGGFSEVKADIDTLRSQVAAQDGAGSGKDRHEAGNLFFVEFSKIGEMTPRGEQKMAVGVRKTVEQDNGQPIAKKEQVRFVLPSGSGWFKEAAAACGG